MKPNFSGYATKYGVLCTDGRTIVADAFKHEDKKRVPLMWRHDDKTPENVLGYAILEHEAGVGVKTQAFFNSTPSGLHAKSMVEHGDIDMLSIKAIRLQHEGTNVVYGDLTEVSLVPTGANKEARIDSVYLEHADGMVTELEHEGIIFSGEVLTHEDAGQNDEEDEEEGDGPTAAEVFETLNDDQKALVEALISQALDSKGENNEGSGDSDNLNHEGDSQMARNVFSNDQADEKSGPKNVLTHEEQYKLIQSAAEDGANSLKNAVLTHAEGLQGPYGITNIEELFPDHKNVTDRPEWIKRDTSWVAEVLSGVRSVPFTRIKSSSADVTHEEARAKGYIKGTRKKNEFFRVASRTTEPKTIYKRQGFDRDDILDLTDFDVVAWVKEEMGWMLKEEVARAILFGDNRAVDDPDKINEENIRPIATDDEFYTARVMVGAGTAAKDLQKLILRARKLIRGGTSKPALYTHSDLIIDMLLMEDKLGRRYYESEAALASALGVSKIVECEVLEEGYKDDEGNLLLGVLVHLGDYTFGANRGGQETMFENFDIDFNQYKYLIETRRAGALTRHRSAVSLWESSATSVVPEEPTSDGTTVLIPTVTGVRYYGWSGTNDPVEVSGEVTPTPGETYNVEARPATGYRFAFNVVSDWSYPIDAA